MSSTFTFPVASDAYTQATNTYLINHEINLIKISIRNAISSGLFYATMNTSLMTSVNYSSIPSITATDSTGTGAVISCDIGSISNITINYQDNLLTFIPQIQVIGNGENATAHCNVTFSIRSVKLTTFPYCPNENAIITVTGTGSGCNITPIYNQYSYMVGLNVTSNGQSYDSTNTEITCSIDGNLTPITYMINYSDGIVEDIILDDPGSNYTNAYVNFLCNGKPYGNISATAEISGGITNLTLVDSGQNYSQDTKITVSGGNGSGVEISPVIEDGAIVSLNLTNAGSGYDIANTSTNAYDYFSAWKGTLCDVNKMTTLNEQMRSVISYFQSEGYNITRMKSCDNTFYWLINW